MFPSAKRVGFRTQLTEEIQTSKFILAHSDLDILESDMVSLRLPPPNEAFKAALRKEKENSYDDDDRPQSAPAVIQASEEDQELRDARAEEDEAEYPKTPVAGRRKRQREWVWTLGPRDSSASPERSESNAFIGEDGVLTKIE